MNFQKTALMTTAAGILTLLPLCAHANLIANGNFSSSCGSATFCTVSAGDSTTVPGWTVSQGSVDLITGYWQAPPGGGNSVDIDGNGVGGLSLSNTFATTIGSTYTLDFELSGNPDGGNSIKTVEVDVGDVSQIFTFDTSANGGNSRADMKWVAESLTFTATGTLTSLGFLSLDADGSPYGAVIANVDIEPVPEPATIALLGMGLLGMGALRRRSRGKV